jgi:hypothetical protein
MVSYAD